MYRILPALSAVVAVLSTTATSARAIQDTPASLHGLEAGLDDDRTASASSRSSNDGIPRASGPTAADLLRLPEWTIVAAIALR
jgi:hypothetical protein